MKISNMKSIKSGTALKKILSCKLPNAPPTIINNEYLLKPWTF